MPTIKELYDQGQRQFPMRGGGISPMVEWWDCALQYIPIYGGHILCWQENGEFLDSQGNYIDPMDLLPEPLPNQSEQINALVENAKSQTETNLAIIRKLDAKDQRIATLEEALINATELIEQLHYEHLLGMEWLEDEENKYRAIAGGQDNETK